MLKDVYHPQPYLTPYPDPQSVFAEPVSRYHKHLLPLVSIDLSIVDPGWTGKIHLLHPLEPCDDCIGYGANDFYTDYLCYNWLGFQLNYEDRYELLGDFEYFLAERPNGPEPHPGQRDELLEFYVTDRKAFEATRANFSKRHELTGVCKSDGTPSTNATYPMLEQIGGTVNGSATSYGDGVKIDDTDPEDVVPLTPDGVRFRFVAAVSSWFYGVSSSRIYLFFEPKDRLALFTFHYS